MCSYLKEKKKKKLRKTPANTSNFPTNNQTEDLTRKKMIRTPQTLPTTGQILIKQKEMGMKRVRNSKKDMDSQEIKKKAGNNTDAEESMKCGK